MTTLCAPPPVLSGKLVFGDQEQIKALREYEQRVEKIENGDIRTFMVRVDVRYSRTVTVEAASKEEAEELVHCNIGEYLDDADIDVVAQEVEW